MNCIIIYQKQDNTKFLRGYNHDYGRRVGDETNMGWKVLNVLYEFEDSYYQYDKYMRLIRKRIEETHNKGQIKKTIKKMIIRKLELKAKKLETNLYR